MTVFVCNPPGFRYRAVLRCPKCKRRRRHLVTLFEWYDPIVRCAACCKMGAEWRAEGTTRRQAAAALMAYVLSQGVEA